MRNRVETIKHKGLSWTSISNPNHESIELLRQSHDFHDLDLEDCLSKSQRPKIDEYDNYLFLVVQFPIFHPKTKRVKSEEVDIFIGQDYLIMLHSSNAKGLIDLFNKCSEEEEKKKELMEKGSGYLLYEIMNDIFSKVFPVVDFIEEEIRDTEKDVFRADLKQRDKLKDILLIKKDILTVRRIISPQRAVVAQLEHKNKKFLPPDLEVYFDDIVDKIEKIWTTGESLMELIQTLQDTNESIISHNINQVMKTLTIFSVIMLPLTFITGLYGMNLHLPYSEHPEAFKEIIAGMLFVAIAMLSFFKIKRWL